jgi:hypothetical protein
MRRRHRPGGRPRRWRSGVWRPWGSGGSRRSRRWGVRSPDIHRHRSCSRFPRYAHPRRRQMRRRHRVIALGLPSPRPRPRPPSRPPLFPVFCRVRFSRFARPKGTRRTGAGGVRPPTTLGLDGHGHHLLPAKEYLSFRARVDGSGFSF